MNDHTSDVQYYCVQYIYVFCLLEYHENKIKKKTGIENENALKTSAVKEQLKLVEKWKRCDIAKNEIFLAKNRKHLIWLQVNLID